MCWVLAVTLPVGHDRVAAGGGRRTAFRGLYGEHHLTDSIRTEAWGTGKGQPCKELEAGLVI